MQVGAEKSLLCLNQTMGRQLKSGPGWRLGWDDSDSDFNGLVGGDVWAIELTSKEFNHFCQLLEQLVQTMSQMRTELMDEEAITCEASSELIWMEVRGYPQTYSLGFILLTGRRAEGQWPSTIAPKLIQAAQVLKEHS